MEITLDVALEVALEIVLEIAPGLTPDKFLGLGEERQCWSQL